MNLDNLSESIDSKVIFQFMNELYKGGKNSINDSSEKDPFVMPKGVLNFVALEYELVKINCVEKYIDYNIIGQSLNFSDDKIYDIIEIEYKNNAKDKKLINKLLYFDITDCYKRK